MRLFSQKVMRIWVETSQDRRLLSSRTVYRLGREIQVLLSAQLERHKGREIRITE